MFTLCNSCNLSVNTNREQWQRFFTEKLCGVRVSEPQNSANLSEPGESLEGVISSNVSII